MFGIQKKNTAHIHHQMAATVQNSIAMILSFALTVMCVQWFRDVLKFHSFLGTETQSLDLMPSLFCKTFHYSCFATHEEVQLGTKDGTSHSLLPTPQTSPFILFHLGLSFICPLSVTMHVLERLPPQRELVIF